MVDKVGKGGFCRVVEGIPFAWDLRGEAEDPMELTRLVEMVRCHQRLQLPGS